MINVAKMMTRYPDFHGEGYYNFLTDEQEDELYREYGYDIYPIEMLKEIWDNSCGLRFINHGDLDLPSFVPQGTPKSKVRITK